NTGRWTCLRQAGTEEEMPQDGLPRATAPAQQRREMTKRMVTQVVGPQRATIGRGKERESSIAS
ncbi:hypothetical protein GW17_00060192, partial [Ensete ventricosum]